MYWLPFLWFIYCCLEVPRHAALGGQVGLHSAVVFSFPQIDIQLPFSGRGTLVVYSKERLDYLHIAA
jgi:hypothetical protein